MTSLALAPPLAGPPLRPGEPWRRITMSLAAPPSAYGGTGNDAAGTCAAGAGHPIHREGLQTNMAQEAE